MSNPYIELVKAHDALLQKQDAPLFTTLDGLTIAAKQAQTSSPVAMVFAPHPDDECIIGALPLRLAREDGYRVINVAVTLGSNLPRQPERLAELDRACQVLGFELQETIPGGLMAVNPKTRESDPAAWAEKVDVIAALIKQYQPTVCVVPNDNDGHAAHIGTHFLLLDALARLGHACFVVQSEFWRAMATPNALIETNIADTADLIAALACHVGEVQRNPYHLRLTSWMADNVRRGAEVVGGAGVAAPTFSFGTIYRIDHFDGKALQDNGQKYILSAEQRIGSLFK
ncbi:PIG-L family deacetylase [Iodobacter sp. HSC-16F04]|uniref:PIG-L family deacetylase n=1 Tax=Iodobacter violaceini TaxID=3044271 RepID=A0ABX0KNN7_9NEIS|nr:PIG-L family deacetylase [Iodobacter violacea]NHQ85915.1 PIG-L family deacetylase [Iodobacter violacea]